MYECSIRNASGAVYVLTGNEAVYQVLDIVGLNPPKAQINMTTIVGLDGAVYNSAKLETRNIVLTVKINGNVEENRLNLYRYFRTKEWCRFYYSNSSVDVFIDGFVENVECDPFLKDETAQISIICPYPYFRSVDLIVDDISDVVGAFTFPFSIDYDDPIVFSSLSQQAEVNVYNSTATETGVEIEINVGVNVSDILIADATTGEQFELVYAFHEDDKILINTNKGQKSVYLIRSGVRSNIFPAVKMGSVFFQLVAGDNLFSYSVDSGVHNADVHIYFRHYNTYRGV